MSAVTLERIKLLCEKHGTTVSKLESDLGFGANVVYKWKVSDPSSGKLNRVADYFGVTVDYLLGNTDEDANEILKDESILALHRAKQNMPEKDWQQAMDIIKAGFKYAFEEKNN